MASVNENRLMRTIAMAASDGQTGPVLVTATTNGDGEIGISVPGMPDFGISRILPASVLPGPVAVTGSTAEQILHSFLVPKEIHSNTSRLIFAFLASMTNNTNAKTFRVRVGSSIGSSVVVGLSAPTAVAQLAVPGLRLRNRGSKNSQVSGYSLSLNAGTSGTAPTTFSIDFTADQYVFVTVQLASASDVATLEDFEMSCGG